MELAYTGIMSRCLPPNSFQIGTFRALPAMSHMAMSSPDMAQNTKPPISIAEPARIMSLKRTAVSVGSLPISAGFRTSSTSILVISGLRRKHSPIPVIPSSV